MFYRQEREEISRSAVECEAIFKKSADMTDFGIGRSNAAGADPLVYTKF